MLKLSDQQWERIREHFPDESAEEGRPGRKPIAVRKVLEGTPWVLNTGAQWHILPQCYPNYKTVHRRFQQWCRDNPRNFDPANLIALSKGETSALVNARLYSCPDELQKNAEDGDKAASRGKPAVTRRYRTPRASNALPKAVAPIIAAKLAVGRPRWTRFSAGIIQRSFARKSLHLSWLQSARCASVRGN